MQASKKTWMIGSKLWGPCGLVTLIPAAIASGAWPAGEHGRGGDGFAGVRAAVDDEAEAIGEAEFFCDDTGGHDQVPEDRLIGSSGLADARD